MKRRYTIHPPAMGDPDEPPLPDDEIVQWCESYLKHPSQQPPSTESS